ncbi:acetate/propionate family kinase [Butyrivibrio sp. WCD3002]|uniref:acetate/propionate family kinase n=1 Tax=Butyrivibrio sp. WCD3002 TaxID=1280676 RepID=UPI0004223ED0|nr:acetate kinase [Butyrivibrio sp. WCD3002]
MKILVINCGSSSLKFQLIDSDSEKVIGKGLCERIGIDGRISFTPGDGDKITKDTAIPDHNRAITLVIEALTDAQTGVIKSLDEIGAVGHRIVHGGEKFTKSVIIDEDVIKAIEEVSDLAPLHNPANLIGIRACQSAMPGVPMVAVFDTAFHQTMPEEAFLYGIPYALYEKYKIRRYGFHGTSHSYVSKRAADMLGKDYSELKTIVCHLGNGASVSAVKNGKCVDTSMGLTPLEGLIMGTRSGDIDPSVVEFIMKKEGIDVAEAENLLNKKSGVLGLSGDVSSDFRDLEDGYFNGDKGCIRAINTFCYRVAKYVGAYAAAMDGVDCICFTAGVGENGPLVRDLICQRLGFLGVNLDKEANEVHGKEKVVSTPDSKVKVLVVPTNEELAIARDTNELCSK